MEALVPLKASLIMLNVRGCPITDFGLQSIGELTRLQVLDISKTSSVSMHICICMGDRERRRRRMDDDDEANSTLSHNKRARRSLCPVFFSLPLPTSLPFPHRSKLY